MRMRGALVGALLTVAASGTLFGQGFQGGLRGSIKDAGGVVPDVEVTLTNEQTNTSRSTATNKRGEYAFANIDPGSYSVKATLTGYKTIDRRNIPIGTQRFLTLDLTLVRPSPHPRNPRSCSRLQVPSFFSGGDL